MKKRISILLLVLSIILFLVGCGSLAETTYSPYQATYSLPSTQSANKEQTYSSTVSSSKYLSNKIYKGDIIFVFGNFSYEYNRQFEIELRSKLKERGLTPYISTDYPNDEKAIQALVDLGCEYWIIISPEEVRTYEYGDGVATLKASAVICHTPSGSETPLINMYATVLCDENKMEGYEKTIRKALIELSSGLAKELSRYIEVGSKFNFSL